jgi:nitric oxide dioxygenase
MDDLKMLMVKASWSYMVANSEEVGMKFYTKLFELDPSLRSMFGRSMEAQSGKLTDMVTVIIARLQRMSELEDQIASLGRRHVGYGTKPEHYKTVGKALLATLAELLEDRWDTPTQEAWNEVYNMLANAMIDAGEVVKS